MGKKGPTKENLQKLDDIMRQMRERSEQQWREATSFKPGELTPEEEELVTENGLNALNYIPQSRVREQIERLNSPEQPKTTSDIGRALTDRFDGAGYGLFLALIAVFAWAIASSHGWALGLFCGLLMFIILELGYRLSDR